MKKLIYLLGLAMLMAVAACSGSAEKKKSDIRVLMQDSTDAHGVQRMTARKSEVDIKYKGKEYHSFISRTPNDSLPRVVSQMGNTYVDNQIVLRLTRGNERVFSRTFTKKQFESLIGDDFMAKSILDLGFIPAGQSFTLTSFEDGINADRQAMDYKKKESTVNNQTRMTLKMVRNGGWAGTIKMK